MTGGTVVVTGAGGGIGAATARAAAQADYAVCLNYRRSAAAAKQVAGPPAERCPGTAVQRPAMAARPRTLAWRLP